MKKKKKYLKSLVILAGPQVDVLKSYAHIKSNLCYF